MRRMKGMIPIMMIAAALHTGCADEASSETGPLDLADAGSGDAAQARPWEPGDSLGGERPAQVLVPDDYSTSRDWPLVILLHGYTSSGAGQDSYFGLSARRHERGFIAVLPDGTRDRGGNRFWNSTDACCDFYNTGVDDVAYLSGLVAEAKQRLAVDPERVYLLGHSNGGFMSYRMACELGSEISAIATLAGSSFDDAADCAEDGQVSVLQIHGDADPTVLYDGGNFFGRPYPGAREVVQRWAARNGCDEQPESAGNVDVDRRLAGDETQVERWGGCDDAAGVELWTIPQGGHIPDLSAEFTDEVLDFLLSQ